MNERRVRGIVLAHGDMASGMVDAVRKIAGGDDDVLVPLSNEGQSRDGLCQALEELIGDDPAVVFTDMQVGSCGLAARLTCGRSGRRVVIFGVNLPMLLEFVFRRDLDFEELVPRLLEKGTRAVGTVAKATTHVDPAESR